MPRWQKYGAKRTTIDGITFASKREAARYAELKLMEKARRITGLTLQPSFDICVCRDGASVKVARYVADFEYRAPERVIEDVKGVRTETYRLKKRLVEAQYGITITEVR